MTPTWTFEWYVEHQFSEEGKRYFARRRQAALLDYSL